MKLSYIDAIQLSEQAESDQQRATYRDLIQRSHDYTDEDVALGKKLIKEKAVGREQLAADYFAHMNAFREHQEAEAAERLRAEDRKARLDPLKATHTELVKDVDLLESLLPFQDADSEFRAVEEGAVAMTYRHFWDPRLEPSSDSVVNHDDLGRVPPRFVRANGWISYMNDHGIGGFWKRADGLSGLFLEQAVARQFDDCFAPLADRIGDYLAASTRTPDYGHLDADTDVAEAQLREQNEKARARRQELQSLPEGLSESLKTVCAAGAYREPGKYGHAFLVLVGHTPSNPGHYLSPRGGNNTVRNALEEELKLRLRPKLREIVMGLAKHEPPMPPMPVEDADEPAEVLQ
jgi:hypothetical protein